MNSSTGCGPMTDVTVPAGPWESLAPVSPDLSDLPPAPGDGMVLWYRVPWGRMSALVRRVDDRRYVAVLPFLFTHAVVWGYVADFRFGYSDRWCYETAAAAVAAGSVWGGPDDDEPDGWHRHPASGRRRDADGNEWINR